MIQTVLVPGVGWPGSPVPRVGRPSKPKKPKGARGMPPKLSAEQIQHCLDSTAPAYVLAELFDVHPATISRARRKAGRYGKATSPRTTPWPTRKDTKMKLEILQTRAKGTHVTFSPGTQKRSKADRAAFLEDAIRVLENEVLSLYPNAVTYPREGGGRKTPAPGR